MSSVPAPAAPDYGADSGGRIKGLTVVKPIIIGNVAKHFGKKREEDGHTHQWTVYIKPYLNEDYSAFIKKVHFKLHDSYSNPNRIVTKPPYEVVETGWGEFEVIIKIHFNDPVERPVTVIHILKLFQSGTTDPSMPHKNMLISESYDEIVFMEPTALMKSLLDNIKPLVIPPDEFHHDTDFEARKQNSSEVVSNARGRVKTQIQDFKERLKLARETIDKFKEALANAKKNSDGT